MEPLRPFTPVTPTSPTQQRPISQRSSSFSSARSIAYGRRRSSNSSRRLSNASRFSNGYDEPLSPLEQRNRSVSGMGTLADELDSADDEDWDQADSMILTEGEESPRHQRSQSIPIEDALEEPTKESPRDSGVDVESHMKGHGARRKQSVSFEEPAKLEDAFTLELEAAMQEISSLAHASTLPQADTTSRTLAALRDLSNQVNLETLSHRLTTSSNSTTSSLTKQTKFLQSTLSTVFSPLASLTSPLSPDDITDLLALTATLHASLPQADQALPAQFAKLNRDTSELQRALASLLDSLQMGKQLSTTAARSLKVAQNMVTDLRREHERAEEGRWAIKREEWESKLEGRWCAAQCRDVVGGFERFAEGLRGELVQGGEA